MHHYFEAITNTSGDSLVGYYARVIDPTTQNTVTMSADDNGTPIVTKSGVDNMGSTDDYGNLDFYVVPGTYHLDIYAPNATSFIFRVPNVAMNSSKGDPGPQGDEGPAGEGLAEVMAPTGAGLVGFRQSPTTAVDRSQLAKSREVVSTQDYGAKGDFVRSATEQQGFMTALSEVRNPNDGSFSGAVHAPAGTYQTTAPIILPSSFVHLNGSLGTTIWANGGQHNLRANGSGFVLSDIKGMRLYGGVDGIRADTAGEIASLTYEDIAVTANTGNAFYFQAGLTSSTMSRLVGGGTHAVWCAGGINNNNVWSDCHFYNASDDVIRIDGSSSANQFRNVHVEGGGVLGKAQFALAAPVCNHIIGGWSEGSHPDLIRITVAQADPMAAGVIIDGLTSIGSSDFVSGFTGSKFDTGNNRIVLGSNAWLQTTTAPARVFIYGVNRNMLVQGAQVWTRDTNVDKRVVGRTRTVIDVASQTIPLFTVTRAVAAADPPLYTNQQAISIDITFQFTGFDTGGTPRGGVFKATAFMQGVGSITSVQSTAVVSAGPIGGITFAIQQGALSATSSTVNAVIQGLSTDQRNYMNYSLEVLNVAGVEANGFVVSV